MKAINVLAFSLCWLSLAPLGCDPADADIDAGDDVELRDWTITCPPRSCGINSAEVNGRSIRELNLDGVVNGDGVKITGFLATQALLGGYELDVQDDELVATNGTSVLRGDDLVGSIILTKQPGLLGLIPYPILIAAHDPVDSWADGADPIATYALLYPDLAGLFTRNVCNGDVVDLLTTTASVLGGETYNLTTKTVNATNTSRWFTIACPGSAADKVRMLGYGPQSDFDGTGLPATVDQRQATLKMITADYCGGGTSYTQNGTMLQWDNAAGTVEMEGPLGDIEAVWTKDGAVCLDATRIEGITVGCSRPTCGTGALPPGEWITHVPPQ
jgi:hypothetical protein